MRTSRHSKTVRSLVLSPQTMVTINLARHCLICLHEIRHIYLFKLEFPFQSSAAAATVLRAGPPRYTRLGSSHLEYQFDPNAQIITRFP